MIDAQPVIKTQPANKKEYAMNFCIVLLLKVYEQRATDNKVIRICPALVNYRIRAGLSRPTSAAAGSGADPQIKMRPGTVRPWSGNSEFSQPRPDRKNLRRAAHGHIQHN